MQEVSSSRASAVISSAVPVADSATVARNVANRGPLNEVVCGAMMLAYERSGCWQQVNIAPLLARNGFLESWAVGHGHDVCVA